MKSPFSPIPLILGLALLSSTPLAAAQVIDQSQPNPGLPWTSLNIYPTQSFTPTANEIVGAGVYLTVSLGIPGDVTFDLWDGIPLLSGSTIIANAVAPGVSSSGWVDVFWPSTPITPGATYYLMVTNPNPLPLRANGLTGDPYVSGEHWYSWDGITMLLGTGDLTFRTWEPGGGLTLTTSGSCPGPVQISVAGATPLGDVGFAYGNPGTFVIPSGSCLGTVLAISNPTLAGFFPADAAGSIAFSPTVPAGICGLTLQAIDATTCLVSAPVVL